MDSRFDYYLSMNWYGIRSMWAAHAQKDVVTFGNNTNNRVESAHRQLKEHTKTMDKLKHAVQRVHEYSVDALRQAEMQCAININRRQEKNYRLFYRNLFAKMTTFACNAVLDHLKNQPRRMPCQVMEGNEQVNHFQPLINNCRWQ